MSIDTDKAAEFGNALIALTQHGDQVGNVQAWKGMDWALLGVMYQKGWFENPVGWAKSVVLTKSGLTVAHAMQHRYVEEAPSIEAIRAMEDGMWTSMLRNDQDWFDATVQAELRSS